MTINQKLVSLAVVAISTITLSACGSSIISSQKTAQFSNDDQTVDQVTPYVDQLANQPVKITETKSLNQEFTIQYKTFNPDGTGKATFKAKSFKEISKAGDLAPENGKKLYALELSAKGYQTNKGSPSTFNQTGDIPSPQFVLVDRTNNKSYVEETDYSTAYNETKNYYSLDKLTMDGEQTVTTAIVFQIDKNLTPDLAFRFVNTNGDTEFYAISQ
jgi:hypothetical protein